MTRPPRFQAYRTTIDQLNTALGRVWESSGEVTQVIHQGGRDFLIVYKTLSEDVT